MAVPPFGVLTSGPGNITAERAGLGDVGARWPNLRIFQDPGPQIVLAGDKSRAVVPFKVPYYQRFQLAAELIGWPYWDNELIFKRNLPESFRGWEWAVFRAGLDDPLAPLIPTPVMHCTQILSIKGIGNGAQDENLPIGGDAYYPEPTYDWARVEALFETLIYDVKLRVNCLPDTDIRPVEIKRYVIKTEDSGGKYLQFQWGQWKLIYNDGVTIHSTERLARQVNFMEPFKTVRWEWLDVLPEAMNIARADAMLGTTNAITFDEEYAPQTLLLQKFDRKPTMTQLGIRTYRVNVEATYFPSGVNRAKPPSPQQQLIAVNPLIPNDPRAGYWDIVDYETEALRPYRATNFADLFRP